MSENEPSYTVFNVTESERAYIQNHYGISAQTPDWVYQEARNRVVLDGLMAQKRL